MARRPSFLPDAIDGGSVGSIRSYLDKLDQIRAIEEAIHKRVPAALRPAAAARVDALATMRYEVLMYLRAARERSRRPQWFGYTSEDRVILIANNNQHATIIGASPTFDPTHLLVITDAGEQLTVNPDTVTVLVED